MCLFSKVILLTGRFSWKHTVNRQHSQGCPKIFFLSKNIQVPSFTLHVKGMGSPYLTKVYIPHCLQGTIATHSTTRNKRYFFFQVLNRTIWSQNKAVKSDMAEDAFCLRCEETETMQHLLYSGENYSAKVCPSQWTRELSTKHWSHPSRDPLQQPPPPFYLISWMALRGGKCQSFFFNRWIRIEVRTRDRILYISELFYWCNNMRINSRYRDWYYW